MNNTRLPNRFSPESQSKAVKLQTRSGLRATANTGQIALLTILSIVSIYLFLPLPIPGFRRIPYSASLVIGCGILFFSGRAIAARELKAFAAILGIIVFACVLSIGRSNDMAMTFRDFLTTVSAHIACFGVAIGLRACNLRTVERILLVIAATLIVGSFLELYAGLRPLVDAVRAIIYREDALYIAGDRDVVVYGAVRPTFFANEPSVVGIYFSLALTGWYLCDPGRVFRKIPVLLILAAAALYVVRSPTIAFGLAVCLFGLLNRTALRVYRQGGSATSRVITAVPVIVTAGIVLLLPILDQIQFPYLQNEISTITESRSFFFRQIGPARVAREVLAAGPVGAFFGLGYGADETLVGFIYNAYLSHGLLISREIDSLYEFNGLATLLTNSFWSLIVTYGVAGSLLLTVFFARLFHSFGVGSALFWIGATVLFWQTIGGILTNNSWIVPYFFLGIASLAAGADGTDVQPRLSDAKSSKRVAARPAKFAGLAGSAPLHHEGTGADGRLQ